MNKTISVALFLLLTLAIVLINWSLRKSSAESLKPLSFTILQLNDVYEIAPLSGTNEGGMARVATVRNELLKKDPNTVTVLAGDFVSPSFIGTLSYTDSASGEKKQIKGKHMVETMNSLGVDLVTFGNHEFDIPVYQLQKRIDESSFTWISANVLQRSQNGIHPFIKHDGIKNDTIKPYAIREFRFDAEKKVRVGFIGVTLPFNKADSIIYEDVYASVKKIHTKIRPECDVVIALTHLDFSMDSLLAVAVPELDLILGGHEHEHNYKFVGKVPISKADANAKSVYIHNIAFNPGTRKTVITSELSFINEKIPSDSSVNKIVSKWITLAYDVLRAMNYNPERKLMKTAEPLDGRESEIRNHATNYTQLIANALVWAEPSADVALYNSGSLRVDDQLSGEITEYDILRSFPFGGPLVLVKVKGSDLTKILETGTIKNKGSGGYLQLANASFQNNMGYVKDQTIISSKTYSVLMPEFVALGKESNLGFIKGCPFDKPKKFKGTIRNDIVDILINYAAEKGSP